MKALPYAGNAHGWQRSNRDGYPLHNWRWGWHRVTFYGDYRKDVKNLATLMGFQVYEEDV